MTYLASTYSLSNALTKSITDLQTQLVHAQRELSTGRHADLGDAIGIEVGRDYFLGVNLQDIEAITMTNNIVMTRLDVTQLALSSLSSDAQSLRRILISAQNDGGDPTTIRTEARTRLALLISALNTSDGSSFLFAGINSDAPPITNYFAVPSPANKQALDAAFVSEFGFPQTSPNVATITTSEMEAFLSGSFADLFSPANWGADWSSASSEPSRNRIAVSKTIDTSVTANDPALQKLAMGYTMLSDLSIDGLNGDTFKTVVQTATRYIDQAISGLTQMQENAGGMQRDVKAATLTMTVQKDMLSNQIGWLENVDPAEAATRLNALITQLQTAYTLTSHLQQLSLSKYL
jgi:flagellar hook-associated protein 3 FlgL